MKNNIKGDEILIKIEHFEYKREDGTLLIKVGEVIAGISSNKYIAVPTFLMSEAREEFIGYGETSEDALFACLVKIKNVTASEIIE
jgi:hypothetical protein